MREQSPPWFPAWLMEFAEPVADPKELAATLLEHREDEHWLLLGYPSVVSERHLWAAWLALTQRARDGLMVSRGIDGEFLRLLAGTHQMRTAFERAGVRAGDRRAWLVRLPEEEEEIGGLPSSDINGMAERADRLFGWLGGELLPERPLPTEEGIMRLGIDADGLDFEQWEDVCLGHIAVADLSG